MYLLTLFLWGWMASMLGPSLHRPGPAVLYPSTVSPAWESPSREELEKKLPSISLPEGFKIEIYWAQVRNVRSLAQGRKGTVFAGGNRYENVVHAFRDEDEDGFAEFRTLIAAGINVPNGLVYHEGDLYVAGETKVWKLLDVENHVKGSRPEKEVIYQGIPRNQVHNQRYINVGPYGKFYISIGANCDVCKPEEELHGTLIRMLPNGTGMEIYAQGIRNAMGLDWHPETKELWFTDNGVDHMGDDQPPCEINRLTAKGQHFGFPYCHGGELPDPEFGKVRDCEEFIAPTYQLPAHSVPLGMRFYTGSMFPSEYKNQIFITQHGSMSRSKKVGYKISLARVDKEGIRSYEDFATGWLDEESQTFWGRPVDVLVAQDGSLLVSDDYADCIYRISYE